MQRYREVWVVTSVSPYLAVDEEVLRTRMESTGSFTVFSAALLFQNISYSDLGVRLAAALIGPGIVASPSPTADSFVEGEANPQAHQFFRGNGLLRIGTHPFAAFATHYIAYESGRIFQRRVGELAILNNEKRSQPSCPEFNFDELGRLTAEFHGLRSSPNSTDAPLLLSRLMDRIFEQNLLSLSFADRHHACAPKTGPKYDYRIRELTRYGRLVHTEQGEPRIETSFALLHYEKALHEFNFLKEATRILDPERQYMHGVYCVLAIASCLEAVANRLSFDATHQHPSGSFPGTALARINFSGRQLASDRGKPFNALGGKRPEFIAMEQVRTLRNTFVHANEAGAPIDPRMLTSAQKVQVDESTCRSYLHHLRLTVALVFDQLPWLPRPLVTATNVKWLGDLEVP